MVLSRVTVFIIEQKVEKLLNLKRLPPMAEDLCCTVTIGLILESPPALPKARLDVDHVSASARRLGEITFWSRRTSEGRALTTNTT